MPSSTHTPAYKALLRQLVSARTDRGLTQRDVAKRLGWPQSRVSDVETGQRRLDVIELLEMAKLYRKSLRYFLRE